MKKTLNIMLHLALLGLALAWGGGYLGWHWWIFDLLSHFKLHVVLAAGILFVSSTFLRIYKLSLASLLFCVVVIVSSGMTFENVNGRTIGFSPDKKQIKVMSLNVWKENRDHQKTLRYIRLSDPDVIGLYETDHTWAEELESLKDVYPYQLSHPREGPFGICFLSKYPFTESVHKNQNDVQRPVINVTLSVPSSSKPVQVYAFHPFPPIWKEAAEERNNQLNNMARWVEQQKDDPLIVLGDFNSTPWSYPLRTIVAEQKLEQSSALPVCGTWPSVLGFFGIPIDHIFSKNFPCFVEGYVGPDLGSDHHPVHATFLLEDPLS